jgi:phosphatidylserine decarboxylase
MLNWLKIHFQYILPKQVLSRILGRLAAAEAGSFTQFLIKVFIKTYKVNMQEAKFPDPKSYSSFNQFFTRELTSGARPIVTEKNQLALPADGCISQLGDITSDSIIQAKNHDYSLTTLLGGKPELAKVFKNGSFATIYLSPRDYHRVHMPVDGTLTDMVYVPGDLFSVNPLTAENIPGLFARNERVVSLFNTPVGKMAVVLVGATIVASIETVWAGTVTPPAGKNISHWHYTARGREAVKLRKGEEMGRFKLGSTVILCFELGKIAFDSHLQAGSVTRLGELFAVQNT